MATFVPPQPGSRELEPRHRKNLAEWVMWCVLLPLVPIAWAVDRARRGRQR